MQLSLDSYILDVLMRDLTEHDKRPSAFLVYLHVWRRSVGEGLKVVPLSYQDMVEGTGLSKSAVQSAVRLLKRRKLISVSLKNPTATPIYRAERPWLRRKQA
jgi:CRP-like cAMP-binding protein